MLILLLMKIVLVNEPFHNFRFENMLTPNQCGLIIFEASVIHVQLACSFCRPCSALVTSALLVFKDAEL